MKAALGPKMRPGAPETCDGVDDNGITCPGGQECLLGQCLPGSSQSDAGIPARADAGTAPTPVKSGCASAPGSFALLALLAAARRRRPAGQKR